MGRGDQELQAIEQLARRFVDKDLAPTVLHDDRYPHVPANPRIYATAASLGLPGLALPEAYGGTAQGIYSFARMLEIVAATDGSCAALLFTQALARATIIELGPKSLAECWATLRGDESEMLLGFPLYEDPEELPDSVRAQSTAQGYVLDGELRQVACLPGARALIVPALIEGSSERAFFLLETGTRGVSVSDPLVTLGLRACGAADLRLDKVAVPATQRLAGQAAAVSFARVAERFRPALVAASLGVLRGSFEMAFGYAKERKQSKKQIVEHHMVQDLLAGMLSVLDVGYLALGQACALAEEGRSTGTELVSLQDLITTLVTRAATDGVQVLGGNGYMHDYGQEKRMRDAKQLQVVFGSVPTRRLRIIERRLAQG